MSCHTFVCGNERVNFWIELRINAYFWIISCCLTFWLGQSKIFGIYNEFNGRNPINNFIQVTGFSTISTCDVAIWLCGFLCRFHYINSCFDVDSGLNEKNMFKIVHDSVYNSEKTNIFYMKNVQILIVAVFHWDSFNVSIENFHTVFYRW